MNDTISLTNEVQWTLISKKNGIIHYSGTFRFLLKKVSNMDPYGAKWPGSIFVNFFLQIL